MVRLILSNFYLSFRYLYFIIRSQMLRIRPSLRVRAQIRRAAAWQRTQMAANLLDRPTSIPHQPYYEPIILFPLTPKQTFSY